MRAIVLFSCICFFLGSGVASADPLLFLPHEGEGRFSGEENTWPQWYAIGDIEGVAVVMADSSSEDESATGGEIVHLPGISPLGEQGTLLSRARLGVLANFSKDFFFVARSDLAQAFRLDDVDSQVLRVADSFIDDLYLRWNKSRWAQVIVGRQRVPFTRYRMLDSAQVSSGFVPAVLQGMAKNRWGLVAHGDLGAMAYAAGFFEDAHWFEMSASGKALGVFNLCWTPRAPIGPDFRPTPKDDPWFSTFRISVAIGAQARLKTWSGQNEVDTSFSLNAKYKEAAVFSELIVNDQDGSFSWALASEASFLLKEDLILLAIGEMNDPDLLLGGGLSYFITSDRQSRAEVLGIKRKMQGAADEQEEFSIVVRLQTAL